MEWRDQLQVASFRGVEFHTDSYDLVTGRRVSFNEYPFRDDPYPEDTGRKGRVHNVPAYVLGADYMTQRDALIEALEKAGPGTLVRRYHSQVRVQAGEVRISETAKQGGMARFTIQFYEAGDKSKPTRTNNTKKKVAIAADSALEVIQQQFEAAYTTQSLPGWIAEQAQLIVSDLESKLTPLGVIDASISEYTNLPSNLASKSIGLIASLSSVTHFRKLFDFGGDAAAVPTTTPSRRAQATNQVALISLVRNSALVEASRQASNDSYDSAEQAIITRNELADALDVEMQTANDENYRALQKVRAALVNDMTIRAANLKSISSYTPNATLPAVVIAHRLYLDALKDSDIIARNKIPHPGFVTGGYPLEVLNA